MDVLVPATIAALSVPGLGLLWWLLQPAPLAARELAAYADPSALSFSSVDATGFFS